jgi:hypothetical protein
MYITTALKQLGNGKLTSIDPFQKTKSNYNGSKLIMTLKNEAFHELIEDYSYFVLPPMIKKGIRFNLLFISLNFLTI